MPIWAPDMKALYYNTSNPGNELWRIIIIQTSENNFEFEPAQSIINGGDRFSFSRPVIHPNGDRFIMQQIESATEETIEPRMKVIENWEQELEGN